MAWIKPDTTAAIACLHAIARIVEDQGYSVDVLKATRPGYVVHEDDLQRVAEPFHGAQRRDLDPLANAMSIR